MRLKEYGRSPEKRKEFLQHPGLLIVGIDVSKAKHTAFIGTQPAVLCQLSFAIISSVPNASRVARLLAKIAV